MATVIPETVLSFKKPTADFLCSDSGYKSFLFVEFTIKTLDDNIIIFSIKRPDDIPITWEDNDTTQTEGRAIDYEFPVSFLNCKQVQTSLTFAVGPKELKEFRMIERHYFNEKLLRYLLFVPIALTIFRSYDFTFGFCIPNTINSWETTYEVPLLDKKTKQEMIDNPGKTMSDSFFFIDDKLVLHNKASYSYV